MKRIAVDDLPAEALAAASLFHKQWLVQIETILKDDYDVMIALGKGDHTHREWRSAIVAGLARKYAPRRVNAVAGGGTALDQVETYLAKAPGITGQYFEI